MSRQSAGSLVGGAIGAFAGSFIGQPALGFSLGASIGGSLAAPTIHTEGPRLSDGATQSAQYGVPINRVDGRYNLAGQVIWSTGLIRHDHEEDIGGKGGPSGTHTTFTYTQSFAVLLCEGEIDAVRRIWLDGGLIYDVSDTSSMATFYESHNKFNGLAVYLGSETQEPDPTMQGYIGVADTPAYRGWAYLVFDELDVTDYGRIPVVEVEVVSGVSPVFERFVDSARFGYTINDGPDDIRVTEGIVRFCYPTSNRRTAATEWPGGYEYLLPLTTTGDQVVSRQDYDYLGLPNYSLCYTYIMGRIGGRRVITDRVDSGSSNHPWSPTANNEPYMRVESELYYDEDKGISVVCSNDESMMMVWVRDTIALSWALDVYDSGLNLIHHDASPSIIIENYPQRSASASIDHGERLWYVTDSTLHIYQIESDYTLTLIDSTNTQEPNLTGTCSGIVSNNIFFHINSIFWKATGYGRLGADSTVTLSSVVTSICETAGLSASDIDVTDLAGITVDGYLISNVSSARSQIEPLARAYNFDAAEIGGKITFIKRGSASIKTLTVDDLGAGLDSAKSTTVDVIRQQDTELPRRVSVLYVGKDIDGEIGEQSASRITSLETISELVTELPLLLTDARAAQSAQVQLYNVWQSRTGFMFSTNDTSLNPCDVITLDVENTQYLVRITKTNQLSQIGPLECEAVLEEPSIYTPVTDGSSTSTTAQTVDPNGPTRLELIDGSLLQSTDSDDGVYIAASGYYDSWPGSVLMRSIDGANWSQWGSITVSATMGYASTVLNNAGTHYPDVLYTVTVILTNGTLSSVTESQWLNGDNAALIGDEVVLFRTATLTDTDTYELSGLIRGVRGTEWATNAHVVNERFVFLSYNTLRRFVLSADQIGITQYIKPVTIGAILEETDTKEIVYLGNGYKPYAPADLTAVDNGDGTFTATWIRRGRKNAEWRDYIDVPLNEDAELYRVDVWRAAAVLSTADVTSETATVTAITTDIIKVAQVSATVGAGNQSEITL